MGTTMKQIIIHTLMTAIELGAQVVLSDTDYDWEVTNRDVTSRDVIREVMNLRESYDLETGRNREYTTITVGNAVDLIMNASTITMHSFEYGIQSIECVTCEGDNTLIHLT
jgi:hypothetical protein